MLTLVLFIVARILKARYQIYSKAITLLYIKKQEIGLIKKKIGTVFGFHKALRTVSLLLVVYYI